VSPSPGAGPDISARFRSDALTGEPPALFVDPTRAGLRGGRQRDRPQRWRRAGTAAVLRRRHRPACSRGPAQTCRGAQAENRSVTASTTSGITAVVPAARCSWRRLYGRTAIDRTPVTLVEMTTRRAGSAQHTSQLPAGVMTRAIAGPPGTACRSATRADRRARPPASTPTRPTLSEASDPASSPRRHRPARPVRRIIVHACARWALGGRPWSPTRRRQAGACRPGGASPAITGDT